MTRRIPPKAKAEAVRRYLFDRISVTLLAKELGVEPNDITGWVNKTRVKPAATMVKALRQESRMTKEEVAKKAGHTSATQYERAAGQKKTSVNVQFATLADLVGAMQKSKYCSNRRDARDFVDEIAPRVRNGAAKLLISEPKRELILVKSIKYGGLAVLQNPEVVDDIIETYSVKDDDRPIDAVFKLAKKPKNFHLRLVALSFLVASCLIVAFFVPRNLKNGVVGAGVQVVQKPPIERPPGGAPFPNNFDRSGSLRDPRAPFIESPSDNDVEAMSDYALLAGRGIRYWQTGDYNKAALTLHEALRLRGSDVQILILYAESTRLSSQEDDYASSVQEVLKRLDSRRASLNEDDPWLVHLEMAQGKALAALGKKDEAVRIVMSAIRHLDSPGVTSSERITYYLDIADVFQLNGNAAVAKKYLAKARDLADSIPSDEWAGYWCEAFLAWMDRENRQRADLPIKAAIDLSEKQLLPNDRTIAQLYALYADALELGGRIQDAKDAIELALKWAREASDARAESIWRFQLARILIFEGQNVIASNAAANKELDEAIAWQQSQLPVDERTVAIMQACYATSLLNTSEYSSALIKIDEAIRWGESSNQSDLLEAWYRTKAAIYRWMAKPTPDATLDQTSLEKAIAEYKKSVAIIDKTSHYRMYLSFMLSAKLHELNNDKSLAMDDLNAAEAEVRDREIPGGNAELLKQIRSRKDALGGGTP